MRRAQDKPPAQSEEDLRAAEMAWLRANQAKAASLYQGEWIAIDGSELVAHAPDLATLLRQAQDAGHPHPFVTFIPTEPVSSLHV